VPAIARGIVKPVQKGHDADAVAEEEEEARPKTRSGRNAAWSGVENTTALLVRELARKQGAAAGRECCGFCFPIPRMLSRL
jgi:hypothetical protein